MELQEIIGLPAAVGSYKPKDLSVAAHNALAAQMPKTQIPSGGFARYGWWDHGSCNGEDQWMCNSSIVGTGCIKDYPACLSGQAKAVEAYKGTGQCVIRWWIWVCM